jgi:hypothetical protein
MTQIERERADAAMKTLNAIEPRIRQLEEEVDRLRRNCEYKDRMLEDLGNINGNAVAEISRLRKALKSILYDEVENGDEELQTIYAIAKEALGV